MGRLIGTLMALCLGVAVVALAQSAPASYEMRFYAAGAPAPMTTFPFAAAAVTCNEVPPAAGAPTINPTQAVWDDPANPGRVCRYAAQPSDPLLGLPVGSYEATLSVSNDAGVSAESNRASFARAALPNAPTGFKVVR